MPLSRASARSLDDRRAPRWTITIVAAGLLTVCALSVGVARSLVEANRPPGGQQAASSIGGPLHRAATADRRQSTPNCPKGAVPRVVIEGVQVSPALGAGLWLRPGRSRITVRGSLVNDASAAIVVRRVPLTVGGSAWHPHVRFARTIGPYSSETFLARGAAVVTSRERMALAARLSWAWQDHEIRPCGPKGLAEDD